MCSEQYKCAHVVILQHCVTTHSWLDCTPIQVSYLHVEEVYLDYPIRYDRCNISCLHARGISDLPMGNGPGLQHGIGEWSMSLPPSWLTLPMGTVVMRPCNSLHKPLYGDVLANVHVRGMRGQCEGCHLAGQVKRNQGLHQGKLVGRATMPVESLYADVAGPIVPMGIGKAKYVLVVVDECTRYSWVFPMRKKAQTARLLALLIQRINT